MAAPVTQLWSPTQPRDTSVQPSASAALPAAAQPDVMPLLPSFVRSMMGLAPLRNPMPQLPQMALLPPPMRLGGPTERAPIGVPTAPPRDQTVAAPVPAAPPPPPPPMQRGESSDRVRELQVLLKDIGLLTEAPDGTFGRTTERAIIDFQSGYTGGDGQQLAVTGIVDAMTLEALRGYKRHLEQQRRQPSPQLPDDIIRVEPNYEGIGQVQVLRPGATGTEVRRAQELIRSLGYDIQVTGTFDEPTRAAVADFQELYTLVMGAQLETDGGVLGPSTGSAMALAAKRTRESPMNWREYARRYRSELQRPPETIPVPGNQPGPPAPVARQNPALRPGSPNRAAVTELQNQLRELRYDIEPDGDFGPATTAALTDFQQMYTLFTGQVLVADGVLNDATRTALAIARRNGLFDRLPESLRRGQIETGYVRGQPNTIVVRALGDGTSGRLESRAALAYIAMRAAARESGGTFQAGSSFRTNQRQRELRYQYRDSPGRAARPGFSTHQSGIAIDTEGVNAAANTWLRANGRRYGFVLPGYVYTGPNGQAEVEEWHWEYRVDRLPNAVRRFYGLPELTQDPVPMAAPSAPHRHSGRARRSATSRTRMGRRG